MDLSGKRILLGITGGIAAYKSVVLLRDFQKAGASVRVTMTPSATRFVGTETFATLSRHEVAVDVFNDNNPGDAWTKHIHWGEWADLFIIAPCTANTLSKLVHGASDNMLTTVALTARCPLIICPTMDSEMADHPAVQRNLKLAGELGYRIMEPAGGYLASGLEGSGRLPEPGDILDFAKQVLEKSSKEGPLANKKVLVTSGPTREFLDPVRFISNPSTGKMGAAMAEAARDLGGNVTLLQGPGSMDPPDGIKSHPFISADNLFNLVQQYADSDLVIMAAAVSDFKPAEPSTRKIKKEEGVRDIKFTANPDVLEWLGKNKKKGQLLIGFAMETENLEKNAKVKLKKKNLDWILANDLSMKGAGFEFDTNRILVLGKKTKKEFEGGKKDIAGKILAYILDSTGN